MDVVAAVAIGLVMVAVTTTVHYEALISTSSLISRRSFHSRARILIAIGAVFAAHFTGVCLYAIVYFLMHSYSPLGTIGGELSGTALDFFYFSITSYTTLGVGDLVPGGPLRLVAGIEALNGFVLIGWSASFTYILMEKVGVSAIEPEAARQ